jgi:hypothetical protein
VLVALLLWCVVGLDGVFADIDELVAARAGRISPLAPATWVLLVGPRGTGKSSVALGLVAKLHRAETRVLRRTVRRRQHRHRGRACREIHWVRWMCATLSGTCRRYPLRGEPGKHGACAEFSGTRAACLEQRPSHGNRGLAPPYFFSASILAAARVENTQLGNRAR